MARTDVLDRTGTEPVVETRGLGKRYGSVRALQDASLRVAPGEWFGVIGPDGSGKSSLLSILAGVLRFEEGECRVLGADLSGRRAAEGIKDDVGFLPQGLGEHLAPDLSVRESLSFFGRLHGMDEERLEERSARLLEATRLGGAESRRARNLSGGMRQKLGLACTLLHEPSLLLLDEPATGLDPVSRRELWEILAWVMREREATIIASTAYMDEARRFARLVMLHQGRITAEGPPEEILAKVPGRVAVVPTDEPEVRERLQSLDPNAERRGGITRAFVRTSGDDSEQQARDKVRKAMGDDGGDFSLESPELEDVYLALVRQEAEGAAGRTAAVVGEDSGERGEGVIRAEGLVRDFGDFRAVDHVDLQVGAGEVFGLLGANGAGKTTVIRMLIGLLAPTEGQSSVAGVDMARARGAQRNAMGYMSQVFSLYGDLTVAENLETAAGVYGFSRKDAGRRRDELLDACGLRERAGDLAGETPLGFRQRLALGCSVVHEPGALFLDEPTSGVDPAGRRRIWEIVTRAAREGGVAVLATTHSMTEALRCDRVGLMHAGRIKTAGSPEELKRDLVRQAGRPVSVVTDKPMQALPALKERGYREASLFGEAVRVLVRDEKEQQRRIREVLEEQGFEVRSVAVESPTMEDVFAHHMLANQLANQEDAS